MTALSAPGSSRGEDIVSILIPSLRTFRHQLTLGRKIWEEPQNGFCSFNGFMTQVFVIQTDYWVLNIAICTYSILANHKRLYGWLQDHPIVVFLWPWVLSLIWAILGLVLAGYQNIGGFCWFASDRTRLLVNFLPRWTIIFIIIALYLRLTYILLRIQKQLESTEEDTTIILSGHHRTSRNIDLQQKNPQTNSYPHTSDSRSVTANAQRSGPTSKLKKVAIRMMMYPILYMLIWTIPTAIRIYQGTSGRSASLSISCVDKACIVVQGLADSIIYGLNERTWNEWMKWIFPRRSRIHS
uniref:G-protein coupled receptor 1 n=1 Tax=Talaromyces marneffei PM1 TaxID=1077442 RepID=A0A093V255_TALMA